MQSNGSLNTGLASQWRINRFHTLDDFRNFPPSAQQYRSATDCERPCELAGFPCPAQPKRHRRQTLRLDRIAIICVVVGRPMLLAVAAQSKEHRDFASH